MSGFNVPLFAQAQTASIVIDGVTYRVPLIDSGGRVYVNAKATGAGEVGSILKKMADPSNTRATIITPAGGKKIRVIHSQITTFHTTGTGYELYFGTGATITTSLTKAVSFAVLETDVHPLSVQSWPDGGGPVGAANEVLSIRTGAQVNTNGTFLVQYREE